MSHAQVVEDETGTEGKLAHHFGDRKSVVLKGLEDAHGKATQSGDVFRAEASSDAAAVLIVVPVDDVMNAFNAPMAPVDGEYALGEASCGVRLVIPSAISWVSTPVFLLMDSRSIRKTCPTWGKSR